MSGTALEISMYRLRKSLQLPYEVGPIFPALQVIKVRLRKIMLSLKFLELGSCAHLSISPAYLFAHSWGRSEQQHCVPNQRVPAGGVVGSQLKIGPSCSLPPLCLTCYSLT